MQGNKVTVTLVLRFPGGLNEGADLKDIEADIERAIDKSGYAGELEIKNELYDLSDQEVAERIAYEDYHKELEEG